MNYTLRIRTADKKIFEAIKRGKKQVETRAGSVRYKKIQAGDGLIFVCGKEKLIKTVKEVKRYRTTGQLFKDHSPAEIIPGIRNSQELEKVFLSFPGYGLKIKKFGLIAFKL